MRVGFSQVGLPTCRSPPAYSAAMLLALPWVDRRDTRWLPASAAMFALAMLAKGLVHAGLAAPSLPAVTSATGCTRV